MSSLPSWVGVYHPDLNSHLQEQLNTSGLDYTELSERLTSWAMLDREKLIRELLNTSYGYLVFKEAYGLPDTAPLSAYSYFNMGGFLAECLRRPVSYYDAEWKLEADIKSIPRTLTMEIQAIEDAKTSMAESISKQSFEVLLHQTPMISSPLSRDSAMDKLFIEYGYKNIFTSLNVGSLVIPSRLG